MGGSLRTNSYEFHGETGRWTIPKTSWIDRICHLCETKKVDDEKHFSLRLSCVHTH